MIPGTITSRQAVRRRPNSSDDHLYLIYATERVLAVCALVAAAPVLATLAIVTGVLSRRSPFIRHVRVGWRGRTLAMWKLRTMWDLDAPKDKFHLVETVSGKVPEAKDGEDQRVASSFASFCRRYSLDELPQLIHVARGEMSLVGPRPITREELEKHYADCSLEVLSVKPGITGLWQVMGRNRLSYAQRRRLDLFLVRRAGVGLYLRILLAAIPVTLSANGAF